MNIYFEKVDGVLVDSSGRRVDFKRADVEDQIQDGRVSIKPFDHEAENNKLETDNRKRQERYWRDAQLSQMDIEVNKLEDQGQDASAFRAFRVVLRNYPQQVGFPNNPRPKLQ